jgi:hypothetical protein
MLSRGRDLRSDAARPKHFVLVVGFLSSRGALCHIGFLLRWSRGINFDDQSLRLRTTRSGRNFRGGMDGNTARTA